MPALPTTQDVRWVRKQAEAGITGTLDAVRKPLLAVLGAVDVATHAELRKLAETCSEAMQKAYSSLAERGEGVFDEFRSQPRVQQVLDSVTSGVDTAQERLEVVVGDLNSVAADLRSRFARTSRSVGETAAQRVRQTADEVSVAVTEAGEQAATQTRSVTRRAANRAASPRKPATRRPGEGNTRGS